MSRSPAMAPSTTIAKLTCSSSTMLATLLSPHQAATSGSSRTSRMAGASSSRAGRRRTRSPRSSPSIGTAATLHGPRADRLAAGELAQVARGADAEGDGHDGDDAATREVEQPEPGAGEDGVRDDAE